MPSICYWWMQCKLLSLYCTTYGLIISLFSIFTSLYFSSSSSSLLIDELNVLYHLFLWNSQPHSTCVHQTSYLLVPSFYLQILSTLFLCCIWLQIHYIYSLVGSHNFYWCHIFALTQYIPHPFPCNLLMVCWFILP